MPDSTSTPGRRRRGGAAALAGVLLLLTAGAAARGAGRTAAIRVWAPPKVKEGTLLTAAGFLDWHRAAQPPNRQSDQGYTPPVSASTGSPFTTTWQEEIQYVWDFGDGEVAFTESPNAAHRYAD